MRKIRTCIAIAVAAVALGACESVEEQLGLAKNPPDEFRVVSRAPLSVPPEFKLRPPAPGAPRPQEGTASQQARQAVFRNTQTANTDFVSADPLELSEGERALLTKAGAQNANPDIRQIVNREAKAEAEESEAFVESLLWWREPEKPGTVIDAEKEAARLRTNAALGQPASEGEVPTIERKEKAIFEGLF